MTSQNSLKRRIRARMASTGESYSTARNAIMQPTAAAHATVVLAQPHFRSGDFEKDLAALFAGEPVPKCDVLVLPELFSANADRQQYRAAMQAIATRHRCFVVGGSNYVRTRTGVVNSGIVVNASGEVVSTYEKIRPYGSENDAGVAAGSSLGAFEVEGRSFAVVICSDLWFSDTLSTLTSEPDVLLVPSFSITQRDTPTKTQQLWQHMLVARAYEHSAYVGVCDWAQGCLFDGLPSAGVSGFADPRPNSEHFFQTATDRNFKAFTLDFHRLEAFRQNRARRGFAANVGV